MNFGDLPIAPYLGRIADELLSSRSRFLVLTAETAAGKSTAVPPALLDRVPGKILMLEPRRIATVAIAARIAEILGEECGRTAGYRIHLESKVSPATRIEIITEAVLTRMIQEDPSLPGVSVVILDEFHERSVHADLALALLREVTAIREDLRVLVMSATIDTARIASFLGCTTLSVPGRLWPVETVYDGPARRDVRGEERLEDRVARTVRAELASPGGHILVFLPGIAELRRVSSLIAGCGAEVFVLHSSVPFAEQKLILSGNPEGPRRVILSSSIAETSVTVPGVSIVIDSGLSRIGRFDVPTGMNRLVTEIESEFSAVQRAGRAGRTGPGRCVRLWAEHEKRVPRTPPEILRSDILPLVLECALWGAPGADGLDWLDPPNAGAWARAVELLAEMGALDPSGRVTARGKAMASLGVHPRIAAVALAGNIELAVRHAGYPDNPRETGRFRADLERRVSRVECAASGRKQPDSGNGSQDTMALLAGYPDRIASHRAEGVYQFPSGRLASLPASDRASISRYPGWIVAPDADAGEREGRIYAWEPLDEERAAAWLDSRAVDRTETAFYTRKDGSRGIRKTIFRMYGKLVISEKRIEAGTEETAAALCAEIRKNGLQTLPWNTASSSFLARARFLEKTGSGRGSGAALHGESGISGTGAGPSSLDDQSLLDSLEDWLVPFLGNSPEVDPARLLDAIRYRCDARTVDREVPERITLATGATRPLVWEEITPGEGPVPVLETKIQDLFGCADTPRIRGQPVLLRLLSPARRPLQITCDLAGFWKNTWPEVIKEMKGRYPKHRWPDNPLAPS